jgi:anti-sigma regulatory factor (Ser/Thr protein kinase)
MLASIHHRAMGIMNEISFLDSFKADTAIVPEVIDRLITDLKKSRYPQEEVDEIILSMDEAITNAVQETISTLQKEYAFTSPSREITVRYTICPREFDATVIDHGKGLDINKMVHKIPDSTSSMYHEQIFDYIKNADILNLKVRLNGNEIKLNGIGAGLKIILSFMDSVSIDLIDKKTILAESVTEFTDGTILNMRRIRRY